MGAHLLDCPGILDIRDDPYCRTVDSVGLEVDTENPLEAARPGRLCQAFCRRLLSSRSQHAILYGLADRFWLVAADFVPSKLSPAHQSKKAGATAVQHSSSATRFLLHAVLTGTLASLHLECQLCYW